MNIPEYLIFRHTFSKRKIRLVDDFGPQTTKPDLTKIESILKRNVSGISNFSAFVSGGLDSSLMAAIAKPKVIYSATFPEFINDESVWAQIVASHIGARLVLVPIKKAEYLSTLEYLIRYKQDGLHPNEPCLYIVAKKAVKDGVRLMLSGEGADDIFGGYTDLLANAEKYFSDKETFLTRYAYARPSKFGYPEDIPFDEFKKWGMEKFILKIHTQGLINRALNACYAAGIDVRFPYLLGDLPQYMWNCYPEFKNNKNTLKQVAEKYLPHEIICRKKIGFPVPLNEWLGGNGIEEFLKLNVSIWQSIA